MNPPADFLYKAVLNITLNMRVTLDDFTIENTDPVLVRQVTDLYAAIGSSFYHNFGDVYDEEDDTVTIEIDLGDAA